MHHPHFDMLPHQLPVPRSIHFAEVLALPNYDKEYRACSQTDERGRDEAILISQVLDPRRYTISNRKGHGISDQEDAS